MMIPPDASLPRANTKSCPDDIADGVTAVIDEDNPVIKVLSYTVRLAEPTVVFQNSTTAFVNSDL